MRFLKRRRSAVVLSFGILANVVACGGGGSGGDSQPPPSQGNAIGTIQLNKDPQDPELAVLTGGAIQDELILYGEKDATGYFTRIQTAQYRPRGSSSLANMELDDFGKPVRIVIPDEGVLTFEYAGNVVTITLRDISGNFYSENILAPGVPLPGASTSAASLRAAHLQRGASDSIITVERVDGAIETYIIDASTGDVIGNVDPDRIDITGTNPAGPPPPWRRESKGRYNFIVSHRTADLNVLAQACGDDLTKNGLLLGRVSILAGIVAGALTFGVQIPIRVALAFLYGAGSMFATYQGDTAAIEALKCKDLVRKALVDRGLGKQSVAVTASLRNVRIVDTFVYDLFDTNDPIGSTRHLVSTMKFPIHPGFEGVATVPAQPRVGESYQLSINAILPQGGYITWELIRPKENYSSTGKWTNAGVNLGVTALVGPFPGASSELGDVVTLKAYYMQGASPVLCGTIIKVVNIRGKQSTRVCPQGVWLVRSFEYCDPTFLKSVSFLTISPGGTWEADPRDNIETDSNSRWTLDGTKIVLRGKPTANCNERYHEGTVTDISSGCSKMEGKTYIKCQSPSPFVLENCWVATLDSTKASSALLDETRTSLPARSP